MKRDTFRKTERDWEKKQVMWLISFKGGRGSSEFLPRIYPINWETKKKYPSKMLDFSHLRDCKPLIPLMDNNEIKHQIDGQRSPAKDYKCKIEWKRTLLTIILWYSLLLHKPHFIVIDFLWKRTEEINNADYPVVQGNDSPTVAQHPSAVMLPVNSSSVPDYFQRCFWPITHTYTMPLSAPRMSISWLFVKCSFCMNSAIIRYVDDTKIGGAANTQKRQSYTAAWPGKIWVGGATGNRGRFITNKCKVQQPRERK